MSSSNFFVGFEYLNQKLSSKLRVYNGSYLTLHLIEGVIGMPGLRASGVKHWAIGFEFSDLLLNGDPASRGVVQSSPVIVVEICGGALVNQISEGQYNDAQAGIDNNGRRVYMFDNRNPNCPNTVTMTLFDVPSFDKWKNCDGRTSSVFVQPNVTAFTTYVDRMAAKLDSGYSVISNNCQHFASDIICEYNDKRGFAENPFQNPVPRDTGSNVKLTAAGLAIAAIGTILAIYVMRK